MEVSQGKAITLMLSVEILSKNGGDSSTSISAIFTSSIQNSKNVILMKITYKAQDL
jgi:hypothetical protein